eukprot:Nitzschia sp. Nitz4//scaffold41_size133979//73813//75521//NITZ4_003353-RA/size133979-snap-gene-0.127-mRNA-1//-1//CDS//3329551488//3062//frame0
MRLRESVLSFRRAMGFLVLHYFCVLLIQVEAFVPTGLSVLTRLPIPCPSMHAPARRVKSPSTRTSILLHARSKDKDEDYPNRYFEEWKQRQNNDDDDDDDESEGNIRVDSSEASKPSAVRDLESIHSPQDAENDSDETLEPVKLDIRDPPGYGSWLNQDLLLFRHLCNPPPDQLVSAFVASASTDTVQAMTGTVTSLVGGFSNPSSGIEVNIQGDREQFLTLNHQFLMTGYLYRNVEYVLAIRELLGLQATAKRQDYCEAFRKIAGHPKLGFLTIDTVQKFFDSVYGNPAPLVEAEIFVNFFDQDEDGIVSWEDFQTTIGALDSPSRDPNQERLKFYLEKQDASIDEDSKKEVPDLDLEISGNVEFGTPDGAVWKEDAKVYVELLREESRNLRNALAEYREQDEEEDETLDVAKYVASRNGDLGPLISQITPDITNAMEQIGEHALEKTYENAGWDTVAAGYIPDTLDIPGNVLQQSVLWQMVMGYKLREMEATGDYMKLKAAPRGRGLPFT